MSFYFCLAALEFLLLFGLRSIKFSVSLSVLGIVFLSIVLGFISGFQGPEVGRDRQSYILMYDSLPGDTSGLGLAKDVGYYLLSYFFRAILGFDHQVFFFLIVSGTVLTILLVTWKLSGNFYLSVLLYLTQFFLIQGMVQLRVQLAVSFLFLCIFYLSKRRFALSLAFLAIGASFQYSAIIFSVVYLVRCAPTKKLLVLLVAAFFVSVFLERFIAQLLTYVGDNIPDNRITSYLGLAFNGFDLSLNRFKFVIVVKLIFLLSLTLVKNDRGNDLQATIQIVAICMFWLLNLSGVMASRVYEIFAVFEIIFYANLANRFREKRLFLFVIVGYCFLNLVGQVFISSTFGQFYFSFPTN